ncbi:MAG: hypothetical protein K2O77_07410 [Limosilactobacillus sp.]|uniref:hypothetical protein n=1 Tax=Limosilactobacillus sp. TaxID=2773925 RepID=UPI0023C8B03E|nr:hypothetical protein [Limosilactobacillus sp.]MDE7040763.1 hypothetical protein [Limosilactobacillus sp.]
MIGEIPLDRSILLTIFIRYLGKTLPVWQGNLMADIHGFIIAVFRANINDYALLWMDTFSFAYKIRRTENGISLEDDIKICMRMSGLSDLERKLRMRKVQKKSLSIGSPMKFATELDKWNFPIRRYVRSGDPFMSLKEVGVQTLDDYYQLDQKVYKELEES